MALFVTELFLEKQVLFNMAFHGDVHWNAKICGTADNAAVISGEQS